MDRSSFKYISLISSYLLLLMAVILQSPVYATPIIEIDCQIRSFSRPYPEDMDPFGFTIRRHWIPSEPISEISSDLWGVAEYQSGSFEIDWWMLDGTKYTEYGKNLNLKIQDGNSGFKDELTDSAPAIEQPNEVQDHTMEDFGFSLVNTDGDAINDHLSYPEINLGDWDDRILDTIYPIVIDQVCWANFRDLLERNSSCNSDQVGGDQCNIGQTRGHIRGITLLPHEEDHDGSGGTFQINAGLNDAWVSEDAPFQGMFVTVFPVLKLIFVAWFTFDSEQPPEDVTAVFGAPEQRWVTALGFYEGNRAELKAELTTGGSFNSSVPVPVQDTEYGTMVIEFAHCNLASVEFDFPSADKSSLLTMTRVVESNVPLCEELSTQ